MSDRLAELVLKISAIVLAIVTPFILYFVIGPKPSISSYWNSDLQPLFIMANAITSYFLFSVRKWELSSLLLMLLTAFSVESFKITHNVIAILFFLYNLYPLIDSRRYQGWILPYLLAFGVIPLSLFWAEVVAILSLCGYHAHLLIDFYRIQSKRDC